MERDGAPVNSRAQRTRCDAPPTAGRRRRMRDVASGPAPTWTDREEADGDRTGRAGGLGLLLATAAAGLSFSGTFAGPRCSCRCSGSSPGSRPPTSSRSAGAGSPPCARRSGCSSAPRPGRRACCCPAVSRSPARRCGRSPTASCTAGCALSSRRCPPTPTSRWSRSSRRWCCSPPSSGPNGCAAASPQRLTLLPSLAVVVLAQVFAAVGWLLAVGLAVVYGLGAAVVLAGGTRRFADAARPALPLALVATLAGWVLAVVDPVGGPAWTVADRIAPITVDGRCREPARRARRPVGPARRRRVHRPRRRARHPVAAGGARRLRRCGVHQQRAVPPARGGAAARHRPSPCRCGSAPRTSPWPTGCAGRGCPGRPRCAPSRGCARRSTRRVAACCCPTAPRAPGTGSAGTQRCRGPSSSSTRRWIPRPPAPRSTGTLPAAVTTAAAGALHGAPPSFATALRARTLVPRQLPAGRRRPAHGKRGRPARPLPHRHRRPAPASSSRPRTC